MPGCVPPGLCTAGALGLHEGKGQGKGIPGSPWGRATAWSPGSLCVHDRLEDNVLRPLLDAVLSSAPNVASDALSTIAGWTLVSVLVSGRTETSELSASVVSAEVETEPCAGASRAASESTAGSAAESAATVASDATLGCACASRADAASGPAAAAGSGLCSGLGLDGSSDTASGTASAASRADVASGPAAAAGSGLGSGLGLGGKSDTASGIPSAASLSDAASSPAIDAPLGSISDLGPGEASDSASGTAFAWMP